MIPNIVELASSYAAQVGPEFATGGAVSVLASIAFAFYRYVWKPQQDRIDAFTQRTESALERRLTAAEEKIEALEKETEQCHRDRRAEQEYNSLVVRTLIGAGIAVPERARSRPG